VTYASEKLREQRYAFSEHEVKQYFPEPKVIAGSVPHHRNAVLGFAIKPDTCAGLASGRQVLPHRKRTAR
jgi:oligopeptidase A